MKSKRLTVLICTNRIDRWLPDALGAIYKSKDVEFHTLLVLDGVQNPGNIFFEEFPGLKILELPNNLGIGGALSMGMEIIETEFVARMDSDDLMHPMRFSRQLRFLQNNPEVVSVSSQMRYIDQNDAEIGRTNLQTGDDVRMSLLKANLVPGAASMFRTQAYKDAQGFNPKMKKMEDYDLWLRMSLFGPIAILDEYLYDYRRLPTGLSTGIRPWGPYVNKVIRSKIQLARHLNVDLTCSLQSTIGWVYLQWKAYLGRKIEKAAREAPEWVKELWRKLTRTL